MLCNRIKDLPVGKADDEATRRNGMAMKSIFAAMVSVGFFRFRFLSFSFTLRSFKNNSLSVYKIQSRNKNRPAFGLNIRLHVEDTRALACHWLVSWGGTVRIVTPGERVKHWPEVDIPAIKTKMLNL